MKKFKNKTIIKLLLCMITVLSMNCTSVSFAYGSQDVFNCFEWTLPPHAAKEYKTKINGTTYIYQAPGERVRIRKVLTNDEVIAIPETLNGKKVTSILCDLHADSLSCFSESKNLKTVIIPDGVTCIGHEVFSNCKNLKTVVLPDSVTYIGVGAFYNCENLEKIVLPKHLRCVGIFAFLGCSKLKSLCINHEIGKAEDINQALALSGFNFKNIGLDSIWGFPHEKRPEKLDCNKLNAVCINHKVENLEDVKQACILCGFDYKDILDINFIYNKT